MANAVRDDNRVPSIIGVSSSDLVTPTRIAVNPSTHALLIDATSLDSRFVNVTGDTMTGALVNTLATGNSLVIDTTTLVVDATNNRVGIGTASPLKALDIVGGLRTIGKATAVLTGSIDATASTTVTGVGTLFLNELVIGDRITVTGETRTVTAIASNTSLTVDTAFTDTANDTSPDVLYSQLTTRTSANAVSLIVNDLGLVGVGTAVPTHTLTLGSGSTGTMAYNTADQITNYERVFAGWASNVFTIYSQNAGTGTQRSIRFGDSTQYFEDAPAASSGSPKFTITRTTASAASLLLLNHASMTHSSGTQYVLSLVSSVNQTGTAGYASLLINTTEVGTGNGTKLLADLQLAGTSRLAVTNDGRLYGGALHNNAGAVTGTTHQYIASGTYTPTLFNTANVAASTSYLARWLRVGNVVHVAGKVDVDPTLTTTITQLDLSLPIASNLVNAYECSGTAHSTEIAGQGAGITGDTTNDRASIRWMSVDITNQGWFYSFTYEVL